MVIATVQGKSRRVKRLGNKGYERFTSTSEKVSYLLTEYSLPYFLIFFFPFLETLAPPGL